jgi:hypothetical protein
MIDATRSRLALKALIIKYRRVEELNKWNSFVIDKIEACKSTGYRSSSRCKNLTFSTSVKASNQGCA